MSPTLVLACTRLWRKAWRRGVSGFVTQRFTWRLFRHDGLWHFGAMDHPLIDLINARIARADADGMFDNLPGAGKPLPRIDDPDTTVLNRILKDNGAVPEAVAVAHELSRLRAELLECSDRTERRRLIAEIAVMDTRLEIAKKR
ncbi:DUF1992 domain-containing protein [Sagittula marina]|uniref:DnaJ family domain-containing protein n=2 Tax=Sagittula marina TaxID=943940 RepID=UPI0031E0F220